MVGLWTRIGKKATIWSVSESECSIRSLGFSGSGLCFFRAVVGLEAIKGFRGFRNFGFRV